MGLTYSKRHVTNVAILKRCLEQVLKFWDLKPLTILGAETDCTLCADRGVEIPSHSYIDKNVYGAHLLGSKVIIILLCILPYRDISGTCFFILVGSTWDSSISTLLDGPVQIAQLPPL